MTPGRGTHAVVTLAAIDLRRRPDHRAELTSQLLMGEVVHVLASRDGGAWLRVRNEADGYAGWARAYGLRRASRARTRRWRTVANARVVAPFAHVTAAKDGGPTLSPLFWNGRLVAHRGSGPARRVELPDGRQGWAPAAAIDTRDRHVPLAERVRGLLGTPYLWGGRTPHGFDCSGLVQQLLAEQSVAVPRDAHEQWLATRCDLAVPELQFGDLVFFRHRGSRMDHVGLALGDGWFVHSSGMVRVNSLQSNNPLCDKWLLDHVRGFGRTKLSGGTRPK